MRAAANGAAYRLFAGVSRSSRPALRKNSARTRPEQYPDPQFSERLRDSVLDLLTRPAGTGEPGAQDGAVPVADETLAARLRAARSPVFTPAESALLQQWLDKLSAG
ncbi:hypothetical protein AB0N07_24030 [Streptomyces sp. NPDC051172]|uniref:hypothetical protein n=1 Tax=Streptomyces sp. NPDC051172 TaxID=3155796 RepID=UPI00341AE1F9